MSETEMRFDEDVAIVTGAGRGLGREYAKQLAARGASVVINDLDAEVAESVVAEITAAGGTAVVDTHSVADSESAKQIVRTALDSYGKITVLVNNAGIISYAPFGELTVKQWETMKAVGLDGTFFVTQAAWPHFVTQKYGRVVNVTSSAGYAGNETLSHYGAAKLAVLGLTKSLAIEGAEHGIVVNAIAPSAVTRMNAEVFFGNVAPNEDTWQDDIRAGRVPIGPAKIVAPTVVWLAHSSTSVSGDAYISSSGKVGRLAIIVADGYFNPNHSPEDLADNVDEISSLESFAEFRNVSEDLAPFAALFKDA
ncbi:SDR family NAD(P)-dependent oxidoreductase [Cryobacterium sp. TMS1-20-1]|uniref:SDR family NAD(P)-dependent oxidoreductase n=1 Tax=Cryobacterium sp. TMS1-20-1 TaxID=1259223 RepID=UPI00106B0447|nr:SDR family NAD(P)-dependent oxidoreductase [Cryobacterium sp. TMS1-20-1]TFC70969.1 SDR family NAD(P)-dependent oxidoreductase [Cryobacterium sp. TMS1-20-1]